ncbi:MAG: PAS domain S-box-containing protein [Spirosomataceae bacterium]|jgi:PAS domain S-box-containing protein
MITKETEELNAIIKKLKLELSGVKSKLAFQNKEKEKRAVELGIANKNLVFENEEKEKRAAELIVAQYARSLIEASLDPLATISVEGKILDVNEASVKITGILREKLINTDFSSYFTEPTKAQEGYRQIFEKGFVTDYPLTVKHRNGNLTDVLYNASVHKDDKGNVLGVFASGRDVTEQKWAKDLRIANKELAFQNKEKENRAAELTIANKELAFQNKEKENRAAELTIANKELAFQNKEKEDRAAELTIANKELAFQNKEKENRAAELTIANKELAFQNKEKENRAAELATANKELAFQNKEKENRAAELTIANKELAFQNKEKENRAAELTIANKELAFQSKEKEKRASELAIANKELAFQNKEKENRAAELVIANKELAFQSKEKENRAAELTIANTQLIDFCNIISHNLRAPLVNISMLVDYIELNKEEGKEMFGEIKTVINHLNEVFNELVESLQVRLDREIETENIILKDCLESVLIGFGAQINLYKADIQINFNDVSEISFPQKYLDSIFTNLISNALKYKSSDRNPVIKVKTEKINGDIVLSIADNGLGIDLIRNKDKLFKIRQTFHLHPDAKGFGLFITKTQVEAMGGEIWAESTPGKGSTFFIKFKPKNI